jgi:hypothetical protein
VGAGEDRNSRARRQEVTVGAPERPQQRLHCTLDRQRLRDSLAYCYVPRRKGYANPITVFTNINQITRYLRGRVSRQGVKSETDQIDPHAWVYDIGENSDCSVDALVSTTSPT